MNRDGNPGGRPAARAETAAVPIERWSLKARNRRVDIVVRPPTRGREGLSDTSSPAVTTRGAAVPAKALGI